jgi:hypothetical protein
MFYCRKKLFLFDLLYRKMVTKKKIVLQNKNSPAFLQHLVYWYKKVGKSKKVTPPQFSLAGVTRGGNLIYV